jgi:hypothetical protein
MRIAPLPRSIQQAEFRRRAVEGPPPLFHPPLPPSKKSFDNAVTIIYGDPMRGKLSEGKKRYYLSLTEERFVHLQGLIKGLGLPKSVLSMVVDASIETIIPAFEALKEIKESGRKDLSQAEFTAMMLNTIAAAHIASDKQLKLFDDIKD